VLADVGKTIVALGRMAELIALPVETELDVAEDGGYRTRRNDRRRTGRAETSSSTT
jgi:hypothetical protein